MSDATIPPVGSEPDDSAMSRAELHIEREKIQIERERLTLERERMAAERERWKSEAELKPRAEGRGIAYSTLVFVGIICVLTGIIAGLFSGGVRAPRASGLVGLEALTGRNATNSAAGVKSILLRPVETSNGGKAYLLIVD